MELTGVDINDNARVANETFNLVEYASGGHFHKGKFLNLSNIPDSTGKYGCYQSLYIHSNEIEAYYKLNESLEKYKGNVYAYQFVLDIDDENNLSNALDQLKKFLQYLENEYEVDLRHLKINFSGGKGFHIRIPAILFGGFDASDNLPDLHKRIAQTLTTSLDKFDLDIYYTIGFIRIINSKHEKTNSIAIPLSIDEVFRFNIEEIKELAKKPRAIEYIDPDELEPAPLLEELKNTIPENVEEVSLVQPMKDDNLKDIWDGVDEGKRHKGLARFVGYYIYLGLPFYQIQSLAQNWNKKCDPPEKEDVVTRNVEHLLKQYGSQNGHFWKVIKQKKSYIVEIDPGKYLRYLEKKGFGKIYLDRSYVFVRIEENRVRECQLTQIKDHVMEYVRNLDEKVIPLKPKIEEYLLRKNSFYLGEKLIECIPTLSLDLVKDTKDKCYMFYQNGFVEVTADDMILKDYSELGGIIWESQIIKRDYNSTSPSDSTWSQFIRNVSGNRTKTLQSAIGYLLHGYKDSSNAKVIVLCDEKISTVPSGRSGKSLFGKALSKMKKSSRIDGKNFEFRSQFTFQQVYLDTKIIEFNDVRKDFDFERLFSVVTDDMTIENKREKPFIIPFEDSAKILVSTNYTIKGTGSSYTDRLFEIEFSDHYDEHHKPLDDFGKMFFDEWTEGEWGAFDKFMIECIQLYLKEGLVPYKPINLMQKKIIDNTCAEFVEFCGSLEIDKEYNKNTIFNDFIRQYSDYSTKLTQRTFSKWLETYAKHKG